jgi:hypothetical protein
MKICAWRTLNTVIKNEFLLAASKNMLLLLEFKVTYKELVLDS